MRKKISNPHDSLFKAMMGREETAEDAISEETGGVVMTVAEQLIKKRDSRRDS